jgi:Mn-dependent DtxR family transcriptional regulator
MAAFLQVRVRMSLPFELTTFPKGSLEIIRFLADQDSYAAFDGEIADATGLSDRAFGKAIRRLVTKEYVEMQVDGSYSLTEIGMEAAEAIAAHEEEEIHEAAGDDETERGDSEEFETVVRPVVVIVPRTLVANQPNFLFVRVDEASDDSDADLPVDVLFRIGGDCSAFPEQGDTTVPPEEPAPTVRFEITPPGPGSYTVRIEALQVTQTDLLEAGRLKFAVKAVEGTADSVFRMHTFDIMLQPGM